MKMKHCGPCALDKPATNEFFYANKAKPDGLSTECKECVKAATKQRYETNSKRLNQDRLPYWKGRYASKKASRELVKSPDCLLSLAETELAYIAGLIDGEGSFGIEEKKSATRYVPVMSVAMNSEPTISWLASKLGVTYHVLERPGTGHQTGYVTRLSGRRLILLVGRALPYFITKRTQAEAIQNFGATYIPQKGNGQRHPEQVFTLRAAIRAQIQHLNRPHIYGPIPQELKVVLATLGQLAETDAGKMGGH